VEFFVSSHQWLQGDSLFADLVLPVTCCLEEVDALGSTQGGSLNYYAIQDAATDPAGESKSDYQIVAELAKRFGKYEEYTGGMSVEEEIDYAYSTSLIQDLISLKDLKKKKYYVPPIKPDWQDAPAGMWNFYNDPDNNPLATASGKIDFYSAELEQNFPGDQERPPYAKWITGGAKEDGWTHDEALSGKKAEKYPFLLNTSPGRWRLHCQNDDIVWFREIPTCKVKGPDDYLYEPCWLCPQDAERLGIRSGDIVKIFNDEGVILCGARVSERVPATTLTINKGARPDPISERIDRGGCTNLICPPDIISKHCAGFVVTGYLVGLAKLEKAEMAEWKAKYPDAFARAYDPASGSSYAGWVEGVE
jgi:trimethylamine-N-oxide reductase (cytochrome c)